MGTRLDTIKRMHLHRHWVRGKLLTAARKLSPEGLRKQLDIGIGSVWGTLVHLYGSENVWMNVLELRNQSLPFPTADSFANLDALEKAWKAIDQRWTNWLNIVNDEVLDIIVQRVHEGKTTSCTVMDVLIHVSLHQQYHAAQIMNMLKKLGVQFLPECDMIVMAREHFQPARA